MSACLTHADWTLSGHLWVVSVRVCVMETCAARQGCFTQAVETLMQGLTTALVATSSVTAKPLAANLCCIMSHV